MNQELKNQKDHFFAEFGVLLESADHFTIFDFFRQRIGVEKERNSAQKQLEAARREVAFNYADFFFFFTIFSLVFFEIIIVCFFVNFFLLLFCVDW